MKLLKTIIQITTIPLSSCDSKSEITESEKSLNQTQPSPALPPSSLPPEPSSTKNQPQESPSKKELLSSWKHLEKESLQYEEDPKLNITHWAQELRELCHQTRCKFGGQIDTPQLGLLELIVGDLSGSQSDQLHAADSKQIEKLRMLTTKVQESIHRL